MKTLSILANTQVTGGILKLLGSSASAVNPLTAQLLGSEFRFSFRPLLELSFHHNHSPSKPPKFEQ